jgi:hypothetical protein
MFQRTLDQFNIIVSPLATIMLMQSGETKAAFALAVAATCGALNYLYGDDEAAPTQNAPNPPVINDVSVSSPTPQL